ncbi:MAG TPA: hypothetical protein PKW95_19470 [bacterium]|nr:hypothetical protein [bacterium]
MIAPAGVGMLLLAAGVVLPHRLARPWDALSALLGPLGLGLLAAGVLGGLIPGFFG